MKKYLLKSGVAWFVVIGMFCLGYIWGGWKVGVTIPLVFLLLGAGALLVEKKNKLP